MMYRSTDQDERLLKRVQEMINSGFDEQRKNLAKYAKPPKPPRQMSEFEKWVWTALCIGFGCLIFSFCVYCTGKYAASLFPESPPEPEEPHWCYSLCDGQVKSYEDFDCECK